MQRSNYVGRGLIFWFNLLLRAAVLGKCFSRRARNYNLSLSVTAVGFSIWFFSSNLYAKRGFNRSSPVHSQRITFVIQVATDSARGLCFGGEDS